MPFSYALEELNLTTIIKFQSLLRSFEIRLFKWKLSQIYLALEHDQELLWRKICIRICFFNSLLVMVVYPFNVRRSNDFVPSIHICKNWQLT